MKDVRLLTLYKQHYMNCYKYELKSHFSCFGHFDGMDIKKVDDSSSKAAISQLWNTIEETQENFYGGYSSQNIGIFRCVSEEKGRRKNVQKVFWEEFDSMPFTVVAFLQLSDSLKYEEISDKIENEYTDLELSKEENSKCNVLAYTTYDNVDIVVLLNSNSICRMEKRLKDLQELEEVEYLYSIIGLSEQYLEDVYHNGFENVWKGTRCFIQDRLSKIRLKLITKGRNTITKIKEDVERICAGTVICSHDFGDTSATVTISNTNVITLLKLILPNGIVTHQNEFYGETLYNIETTFSAGIEEAEDEEVKKEVPEGKVSEGKMSEGNEEDNVLNVWCENLITKYKEKLNEIKKQGEVSLGSHYRAVIQTLNTLAQYEQFTLGKEIFYLLFPALFMFDRLLDDAEVQNGNALLKNEKIKETIRYFNDCVHSVMCHTISNKQTFFMIPGYSGISFSVPIKLILMYLWVVDKVAEILNDCDYQYECIVTPEMESSPRTRLLDFGMNNDNRLICVHIPQRLLFFPENLMIILAHEVGHYIGKDLRNRELRKEYMVRTMMYALTEMIIPEKYNTAVNKEQRYVLQKIKVLLIKELRERAMIFVSKSVKEADIGPEYYAKQLQDSLINCSKNFLNIIQQEWQTELPNVFYEVIEEIECEVGISDEECQELIQYLYDVAYDLQNNIQYYLASNSIDIIVSNIMCAYREIFSDIVALVILDCNEEEFTSTFYLADGIPPYEHGKNSLQRLREKTVHFLVDESDNCSKTVLQTREESNDLKRENLADIIYDCTWTIKWIELYAEKCYNDIRLQVESQDVKQDVEKIRECFDLFRKNNQASCFDIYENIISNISNYVTKIDGKYQHIKEHNAVEKTFLDENALF